MRWEEFFPFGTRVAALPDWKNPRLYLPICDPLETWEGSSLYPASRFLARVYRVLLRARASAKLLEARVSRVEDWVLGEFARDALPEVARTVVLIGTPGPAQKITAQLRDEKNRVVGYIKYAEKSAARSRLRQEWRMLHELPGGVGPEPLKHGQLGGGEAILISPMAGRRLPSRSSPVKGVDAVLGSLHVLPDTPLEDHPGVHQFTSSQRPPEIDLCFEVLADTSWSVVAQHGDFAPWNLIRKPNGTVGAIDWEYGTLESLPYLDIAHYVLQTSALIHRWPPSKAASQAVGYLARRSAPARTLSWEEASAFVRISAYDTYLKALGDGHEPDEQIQIWRRAVWEETKCDV